MTTRQRSILAGALITGILSTSYLSFINSICCLGVITGGIVAAQQYTAIRSRETGPGLDAANGAVIGAFSGGFGAILGAIFDLILRPVGLDSSTISRQMIEELNRGMEAQQQIPPEVMQQLQGEGGALFTIASLFVFDANQGLRARSSIAAASRPKA